MNYVAIIEALGVAATAAAASWATSHDVVATILAALIAGAAKLSPTQVTGGTK